MTVNFRGYVFNDAGTAVSGASVKLLETGTTTQEGSTATTDSNGLWYFNEADQDRYDVEITSGTSVRRIRWDDQISLKELDVRNNTAAGTPAGTFTNLTNSAANQVAIFRGANTTRADGDEIYISFELADDGGNLHEFARMTAEATDVSNGSEDGQFRFGVSVAGTITDVFTINSTTGGAAEISYEIDSFTIKGGEGEAGVLYLMADQGDDAGDEWKVNVADGGVLTIGNDIASAGSYVTMLTITPHATTASSSVAIAGDATVGDDLSLTSDSSVFNMGDGNDFTITHDGTTGATIAGNPVTITAAGASTWSTSSGALTITSAAALNLNPAGGSAIVLDGTVNVDAGAITGVASIFQADVKIGEDDQTKIDFEDANTINFYANNAKEVVLAENSISPGTSDGTALGTTSLMWSDLFLASGSVVNFNNGDMTVTHSSNTLTVAGGTLAAAAITGTTIDASTDFTIGTTVITDDSIVMTPSTSDTVTIAAATNGVLNITTVDNAAAAANLNVTVDGAITMDAAGNIELDSASGIWILEDGGTEVLRLTEGNSGDVTVKLAVDGKDLVFTDNGDATNMKILDAAAGINVPGEVQTTGIGYTDGDNAITIADGGGITAAAGITSTAASNAFGTSTFSASVYLNDSANGDISTGLTINQGSNTDKIFALKGSGGGHGRTGRGETDTFLNIMQASGNFGGILIDSIAEDGANDLVTIIRSSCGTAATGKNTSGYGLVDIQVEEHAGSNASADIASNGNVFTVRAQVSSAMRTRFLVDEDGEIYSAAAGSSGDNAVGALDEYEDANLVRAYEHARDAKGLIRDDWDKFVQYNEQDLVDSGILGDTIENGGLLNMTGLLHLHNGALWQGHVKQKQLEQKLEALENKMALIEGAR